MNNCGTCKFLGPEYKDSGYHPCRVIRQEGEGHPKYLPDGSTEYDDGNFNRINEMPSSKAFVVDGSGYFAAIRVREDFGCVLWEAK